MHEEQRGGFFGGFVIGALVGSVVAAMMMREESRDAMLGKMREASNLAKDASGDFRGKMHEMTAQWQGSAADLYERGRKVMENARANFGAAVDEGVARADEAREELGRKAEG